jgi:Rieske Fe-S protein
MPEISRRTAISTGALGASVVALAACGSSGSKTTTAAAAPAAAGSATALVKVAQVPVGGSVAAKLNGAPVLVSQKSAGVVAAFSAICTHMGCTVKPAGTQFHCPCHGSEYDAFTGAVIKGPAPAPLKAIPVAVVAGTVTTT